MRNVFFCQIFLLLFVLLNADIAHAIDIWRNQSRYEIDLRLPPGAKLHKKGVDRIIVAAGIEANLRLIQDDYSNCDLLVDERQDNRRKDGFSVASNKSASRSECTIVLRNQSTGVEMSSHYIWLDVCRCYAAVHFTYSGKTKKLLRSIQSPILSSLRGGKGGKAEAPAAVAEDDGLDPNWKAAFAIYKKRGFSASATFRFFHDSALWDKKTTEYITRMRGYIAKVYGVSEASIALEYASAGDWGYDLETGRPLYEMSPQEMARTISKCYAKKEYWKSCQLNYHQEMGCRMTKNWSTVCRQYDPEQPYKFNTYLGDLCFWEPKGDLPMLAAADTSERTVELPEAAPKASAKQRKSKPASRKKVPYCTEEHWPEVFGKL